MTNPTWTRLALALALLVAPAALTGCGDSTTPAGGTAPTTTGAGAAAPAGGAATTGTATPAAK